MEERLKKVNRVLYLLKQNVSHKVRSFIKLGHRKSLILPVLLYGFFLLNAKRTEMQLFERFQNKALKWITGDKETKYINQLRLASILPLPMFPQLNDNNKDILPEELKRDRRSNDLSIEEIFSCCILAD